MLNSYLTNRQQYMSINEVDLNLLPMATGVPQGSVLDPVLLIIYGNDFPFSLQDENCVLFADYTTLFGRSDDSHVAKLDYARDWFAANHLVSNENKTQHINSSTDMWAPKSSMKLLGEYLDSNLSWKSHIDY